MRKVIDGAQAALESFQVDFDAANKEFTTLSEQKKSLDTKIASLSGKEIDATTKKGQRDIANLESWGKEVVTLAIKVKAADSK